MWRLSGHGPDHSCSRRSVFYFVFILFECARVESQPEAPFESIRNGWMLLFLFCLGSLV